MGESSNNNSGFTTLKDIQAWDKDSFTAKFTDNLELIMRYGSKDITESLQCIDLSTLCILQKALCDKVSGMFPQFKESRPVNRQVKHRVIPDIFQLGYSLVNESPSKDLDKIFVSKDTGNSVCTEELLELLQVSTTLHKRVDLLENLVKVLKQELAELREGFIPSSCKSPNTEDYAAATSRNSAVSPFDSTSGAATSASASSFNATTPTSTVPSTQVTEPPSSDSSDSEKSDKHEDSVADDDNPFVVPRAHKKKLSKRERRTLRSNSRASKGNHNSVSEASLPPRADEPATNECVLQAAPSVVPKQDPNPVPALSAAPSPNSTKEIYVGGLSANHGVPDIKNYLSAKGISLTGCRILSTRHQWRSFVLTMSKTSESQVLNQDIWPQGVIVRPFRPNRGTQSSHFHRGSKYRGRSEQICPRNHRYSSWDSSFRAPGQPNRGHDNTQYRSGRQRWSHDKQSLTQQQYDGEYYRGY